VVTGSFSKPKWLSQQDALASWRLIGVLSVAENSGCGVMSSIV